jgi:tRNA A-37 threonylcarbamoyl transferase component Bud32
MVRLAHGGLRWDVEEDFVPHLPEILSAPVLVVKESPVKLVVRSEIDGLSCYIKRYRHDRHVFRPLKFFWKSSQARHEWDLARQLAERGIPIVRHLAHGQRWSWRGLKESILITEAFPGRPLNEIEVLPPDVILGLIARMHELGVLQKDLHPGNILFCPQTGQICLVDLHGICLKRTISPEERDRNLAFLRLFVPLPVSSKVIQLSQAMRPAYFLQRSRRCWKHNREFAPRRYGRLTWQVRLPDLGKEVESILRDPDGFLRGQAEILKPGRSATVGKKAGLVLKRNNFRKPLSLVKDWFRPSRGWSTFRKAYHLELVGIPTARPIAAANHRLGPFVYRSYFLMTEIPGAMDLARYKGGSLEVVRAVARIIARLHNEGFSHRDLKETNLVLDCKNEPSLLDLDGLSFLGTVPLERAVFDLARLDRGIAALPQYHRADRVCFLYHYCRERKIRPSDLRQVRIVAKK